MYEQPVYDQAYIDVGRGPVVLLLHGLFGNVGIWRSTIDSLKDSFRVIVPRLPMYEGSADHKMVDRISASLHEFILLNHLSDVNLIGHAIGGHVALSYAHDHPENVDHIILSGIPGLLHSRELQSVMESDELGFTGDTDTALKLAHVLRGHSQLKSVYSLVDSTLEDLGENHSGKLERVLNKIDHRTLLLWGLEDKVTPPEVALHFHDFLHNSEIRLLANCGHLPMVEQSYDFTLNIKSFLTNR